MNSIEDPAPGLTVGALEPKPLMRDPLNHPPPLLPHPPPVRFSVDVEEVEEEVLEADAHEAEAVVETGARGDENGTATTATTTTTTTTTETMTMTFGAGITHQREALAPASAPAESPPAEDIYAVANAIIIANPITASAGAVVAASLQAWAETGNGKPQPQFDIADIATARDELQAAMAADAAQGKPLSRDNAERWFFFGAASSFAH